MVNLQRPEMGDARRAYPSAEPPRVIAARPSFVADDLSKVPDEVVAAFAWTDAERQARHRDLIERYLSPQMPPPGT